MRFETKIAIVVRTDLAPWQQLRLRLAGIAVYGPRNAVDKVCRGLTLHP